MQQLLQMQATQSKNKHKNIHIDINTCYLSSTYTTELIHIKLCKKWGLCCTQWQAVARQCVQAVACWCNSSLAVKITVVSPHNFGQDVYTSASVTSREI